ncbi:MAG: Nre family DNA repair protein [Desulfurococcaceae archaeon]
MRVDPSLCVLCRGRGLCGLSYCPIIASSLASFKLRQVKASRVIEGSTPPAVFVGRFGYPYVRAGPSAPPVVGDTTIYDYPEEWSNLKIENILEYRWSLVTGYKIFDVRKPEDRVLDETRLLVLSNRPVDVRVVLEKPPKPIITFNEYEPPQGPRSPLESIRIIGNPTIPRPMEKAYYDVDLPAKDAVVYLYESNIPVSHIQKAFSLGSFGIKIQRKLVPTRWSITAVDSLLCRYILKEVKTYNPLNEIQVYEHRVHDNLFIGILYPSKWSYEWMEAWWPGSTWNPSGLNVVVEGDYEDYFGRTTYPGIGGCYYASMLAALEHLRRIKKQATAILMREIYPGFNLPIGVWFVRESCRQMFRKDPVLKTNDLREVCEYLNRNTKLGCHKWFNSSKLLKRLTSNRKIEEYFKKK